MLLQSPEMGSLEGTGLVSDGRSLAQPGLVHELVTKLSSWDLCKRGDQEPIVGCKLNLSWSAGLIRPEYLVSHTLRVFQAFI